MPHDDELHESPLSPADDERIRRLLAEARHTEPMPDTVATRLEAVLGDLVADRDAAPPAAPHRGARVVELAARRRRTAANLLVAAAAVVAVGVGISQVLPQGADDGEAVTGDSAQQAEAGGAGDDGGGAAPESPEDFTTVQVRSKRFGADVRKLQRQVDSGYFLSDRPEPEAARRCLTEDVGAGRQVPASYDGAPAVVVLRVPSGDVQVVDLYVCGDTQPRRSITLTLP